MLFHDLKTLLKPFSDGTVHGKGVRIFSTDRMRSINTIKHFLWAFMILVWLTIQPLPADRTPFLKKVFGRGTHEIILSLPRADVLLRELVYYYYILKTFVKFVHLYIFCYSNKIMNVYIRKQNIFWQKLLAGGGIVLALILFLNIFSLQVRNSFYTVTAPLSSTLMRLGANTTNSLNSLFSAGSLKHQNYALQQENNNLQSQIVLLQDSLKTHQAQTIALQNTKENNFVLVLAKPIGLDLEHDLVTINKGSSDGLAENMVAISQEKVAYGKVVKVYNSFSQIQLISSKNSVIDVKIQSLDDSHPVINGALKGSGSLSAYLDLVSSSATIVPNDVLVTSGLDGVFPRDLLVGKIIAADKNDAKPFQMAQVSTFFDVKNVDSLFVITSYKKP